MRAWLRPRLSACVSGMFEEGSKNGTKAPSGGRRWNCRRKKTREEQLSKSATLLSARGAKDGQTKTKKQDKKTPYKLL